MPQIGASLAVKATRCPSHVKNGSPSPMTNLRYAKQSSKLETVDFSVGTQKKFNWSAVTPTFRREGSVEISSDWGRLTAENAERAENTSGNLAPRSPRAPRYNARSRGFQQSQSRTGFSVQQSAISVQVAPTGGKRSA
jgi:hypothetical protein